MSFACRTPPGPFSQTLDGSAYRDDRPKSVQGSLENGEVMYLSAVVEVGVAEVCELQL